MKKIDANKGKLQIDRQSNKWGSFWRFPLIWMIVGTIGIIFVGNVLRPLLMNKFLRPPVEQATRFWWTLLTGFLAIIVYKLTMKYLARRLTPEIAGQRAALEAAKGALTGTSLISLSTFLIVVMGSYSLQWAATDVGAVIMNAITSAFTAAIVEELIFRGLFLQAMEKWVGSWIALAVSSLFFGAVHFGNSNATIWSSIAITMEAGVLLGAAFLWRRNLWFPMGLHFAWNTLEQLLGIPVSGHPSAGLFTVEVVGPVLLTGGNFGLEGSIVPVIISLLLVIPMLIGIKSRLKNKTINFRT